MTYCTDNFCTNLWYTLMSLELFFQCSFCNEIHNFLVLFTRQNLSAVYKLLKII